MSDPFSGQVMPRAVLIAAATLIVVSIAAVLTARWTGLGRAPVPASAVVAERELRFADRRDGGVDIIDARSGHVIDELAPGTDGFVRATLRSLVRERKRSNIGPEAPFSLILHEHGELTLADPATGRRLELNAFGSTNAAAFGRLLEAHERAARAPDSSLDASAPIGSGGAADNARI